MKKLNLILYFAIAVICVMLFSSCKEKVTDVKVNKITLNKEELTLEVGDTEALIATIEPKNATNLKVLWTSDNIAVATVTENGLVAALQKGKATIKVTAVDGNKTAECVIHVPDYRDKWIGEYVGEYIYEFFTIDGQYFTNTIRNVFYNVSVLNDSCLSITYKNWQCKPKISADGYFLYHFDEYRIHYHYVEGNMKNDSIIMEEHCVSPGATSISLHKGKKI